MPVGLLDRFVVTGWTPPGRRSPGELAVLHLGPYFTGEGSFKVLPDPVGARLVCTEVFSVPGGAPVERLLRLALPVMRRGFAASLDTFAGLGRAARVSAGRADDPRGPDGLVRCPWSLSAPEYVAYHDTEWGWPVDSVAGLYERLTLEAFQSGLAWITILRKRESFRRAFAGFDPEVVAGFGEDDRARLLADAGIVRNVAKIDAAIANARVVADLGERFVDLVWSFRTPSPRPAPGEFRAVTPESTALAKALQAAGIRFVGPDHGVRADAGDRAGRRPPQRLRGPRGGRPAGRGRGCRRPPCGRRGSYAIIGRRTTIP